jgi:hypothetical protein
VRSCGVSDQVEIIFFLTPTGSQGAFVLKRHRRRVLERYSSRVKQGYLIVRAASLLPAGDDFADFAGDVLLADQALRQRHVDLAVGPALADVVDENARALQDARIELLVARFVGADRSNVRAGRDQRSNEIDGPRVQAEIQKPEVWFACRKRFMLRLGRDEKCIVV